MGRVLGVEVADDVARVRCESAQVSLKRIGLRRLYSRKCSHVLYSAACGASPISASALVSNSNGRNVDLDGGVPGSVSGGLAGGWLQTPEGARHMIVNDYGGGVELLYPVEPPRVLRRLQLLRRWSHEQVKQVFPGSAPARRAHGAGAPSRLPIAMGGH